MPIPDPPDRIDPSDAWKPWEPGPADPFDLKWAGHLYRRAGFGATRAELRAAVDRGLDATLGLILNGEPQAPQRAVLLESSGESIVRSEDENQLRGWWVYAMMHSGHPLREKLTLFWHNHFATSIAKVRSPLLMFRQNQALRRNALGKFGPMLADLSRDPAMLVWLDSNRNVKGRANENYAREVMELFTLGVGHYSEKDIREVARAFTGWHTDGEQFTFEAKLHDAGEKTVLGVTGPLDGTDVQRILLGRADAARFLVGKLYRFLVRETTPPPDALLEPLADRFRKSDYDIADLVGTVLRSRHFFSDHAYRQRVKSPVEYVLGAVRATQPEPVAPRALLQPLEAMGQSLFAPPNVKGWTGGKNWLNSATLLARQNFAEQVASGKLLDRGEPPSTRFAAITADVDVPAAAPTTAAAEPPEPPADRDPVELLRREKVTGPADAAAFFTDLLVEGEMPAGARGRLTAFLADGQPKGRAWNRRVREVVHALLAMPEYQLA
jgi:hypothetical protein